MSGRQQVGVALLCLAVVMLIVALTNHSVVAWLVAGLLFGSGHNRLEDQ